MLDRLTTADFDPPRAAAFVARLADGGPPVTLDLLEAAAFPAPLRPAGEGLRLLFRARTAAAIPQGVVTLDHDRHGPLDVFVVPVGRDAEGLLLEAIFS